MKHGSEKVIISEMFKISLMYSVTLIQFSNKENVVCIQIIFASSVSKIHVFGDSLYLTFLTGLTILKFQKCFIKFTICLAS